MYSTSLYGSPLWQLNCEEHLKLNKSWNIAVKMIWDLPFSTHTRFLESLSPVPHLESVLVGRYIGFIQNLSKSSNEFLRLLFVTSSSDLSTVTGQNLNFLLKKYCPDIPSCVASMSSLFSAKDTIKKARVYQLLKEEEWKVNLIEEIGLLKKNFLEIEFDSDYLDAIQEFVCSH